MTARLTLATALATLPIHLTVAPAAAETNCFAATDALTTKRWAEAIILLEERIAEPACDEQAGALRFSLAYATENLATTEPEHTCTAATLYAEVRSGDPTIDTQAASGAARMRQACQLSQDTPNPPPNATLPPDRTTALILTLSATLAAATGGTLLYLGVQADADRQAAETDMRAARDLPTRDAAQTRFEDAADQATTLGLTGWTALALAAGLGAAATWAWIDDGPELTLGVGHVGINVRF